MIIGAVLCSLNMSYDIRECLRGGYTPPANCSSSNFIAFGLRGVYPPRPRNSCCSSNRGGVKPPRDQKQILARLAINVYPARAASEPQSNCSEGGIPPPHQKSTAAAARGGVTRCANVSRFGKGAPGYVDQPLASVPQYILIQSRQ